MYPVGYPASMPELSCQYLCERGIHPASKVALKYQEPIEAPIQKDDILGKLRVVYDEELVGEYDLLASNDVKKVNIFTRLIKSLNYLIWGDV